MQTKTNNFIKMKTKIIIAIVVFTTTISCSKNEEDCKCNQYLKSSNGTLTFYGESDMGLCNGTIANPSPQNTVYQIDCN